MPKTAVGLFENPSVADEAVRDIESIGFPRNEFRTLGEPLDLGLTGVMSIPHIDFEVEVFRELARIGTTKREAETYIEGLRRGGVLVYATGLDEKVDRAAEILNRHRAVETEETAGPEPHLPSVASARAAAGAAALDGRIQAGRIGQPGGGAAFFVW
jgi:hypothetical protein